MVPRVIYTCADTCAPKHAVRSTSKICFKKAFKTLFFYHTYASKSLLLCHWFALTCRINLWLFCLGKYKQQIAEMMDQKLRMAQCVRTETDLGCTLVTHLRENNTSWIKAEENQHMFHDLLLHPASLKYGKGRWHLKSSDWSTDTKAHFSLLLIGQNACQS